ncbi:histidine kinase [Alkalicaulis satelles]|uniref:histidine kinase n=1 Tax=Alkalicaulis satelles TaxID=2609175 RepID=A0A5M6ZQ18_9PROT|nr:ATP-binding protein [Alkalicaulis satelles]KAA5805348.1 histidine kinase [Alkalicaulis satelles]
MTAMDQAPAPAAHGPGMRRLPPVVLLWLTTALVLGLTLVMVLASLNAADDWAEGWRPIRSPLELGPPFWVSVTTGMLAALMSSWIWALKPRDPAVRLFALSGAATFTFCMGAAGRMAPTVLPADISVVMVMANALGASAFGMVMIALFALYPARLPGWRLIITASLVVFGGWTLLTAAGFAPMGYAVHQITLLEMIVIIALTLAQIAAARGDPVRRAIAVWLSASVVIGAGAFIATVAAPNAFGLRSLIPAHYAFSFFLVIYAGLAVGLLRYKVFGLGRWAYQLLFTLGAALAVLAVDAALIVVLALDPARAIGVSLFVVALAYLPARAWLWQRLSRRRPLDQAGLMRAVADVALQPGHEQRAARWRSLLGELFAPLDIAPAPALAAPEPLDDGRQLAVPGPAGLPGLILQDKHGGRALFTPEDVETVRELIALAAYLDDSRSAYDRGASAERTRIARDIHDHIGAQLLTALHVREDGRKDELIRATIGDLRDVIRNAEGEPAPFDSLMADLRAETADRLEAAGMVLDWRVEGARDDAPRRAAMQTLRALVREAASNAIRHAHAGTLTVSLTLDGDWLDLGVADDGRGFDPQAARRGRGLDNMASRVAALGGQFSVDSAPGGSVITARFQAFG